MSATGSTPILVAAAGGLTVLGELARGELPRPAVFIGTAGVGLALLIAAQAAPTLAHGFAVVILLTALLTSGYDVAAGIVRALNRK